MQCTVTTFPVKKQTSKARRLCWFANIKIILPLKIAIAHAAAILNQKSNVCFFPRLKDRHLHRGVEPVFPALHDRQMRPAFLTEALDHGAAGQGIPVTIQHLREGDTLYIESISRLGRSTKDLLNIIDTLTNKGVTLISHKESIDTDKIGRASCRERV